MASEYHIKVIDLHHNGQVVWIHNIRKDCVSRKLTPLIFSTFDIGVTKSGSLVLVYSLWACREGDNPGSRMFQYVALQFLVI